MKKCLGLIFTIVGCLHSFEIQGGIENRPFSTADGYTMDQGSYFASLGMLYTDGADGEVDVNLDIGFGFTDRFELTAVIPYVFLESEQGLGDISVRPTLA